jgi:hypothetical protein
MEKLDWVPVKDDGCRWMLPSAVEGGPFAVLPCDRDGSPVEISENEVSCPVCGKHTLPMPSATLLDVLKKWNAMVEHA